MGLMEKESGGLCFAGAPVPFCKSYSFFLSSLISISCICVKYLSLPYPSFLSFRLFGGGVLLFLYFYLFVVLFTQISLYSMLAMPLPVVSGVCPWVNIQHLSSTRVCLVCLGGWAFEGIPV